MFVKNADYWREGEPHVDEVTIIDFPDDTARVNALLGQQVDAVSNLPAAQIAQAQGNSALKVLVSETGAWQPFTMRVDQAPFDDKRVRQAMRLIVDREQMIQQALSGQGRVANDLYSPFDPAYNKDLAQRAGSRPGQVAAEAGGTERPARRARDRAGVPGSRRGGPGARRAGQGRGRGDQGAQGRLGHVLRRQLPEVGFAQDFWFTRTYLGQVAQGSLKNSPFNETHWNDPELRQADRPGRGELDEGKRTDLLHEAQKIEYDSGGYIVWSFSNQVDAYSAKVGGFQPAKSGLLELRLREGGLRCLVG